jgi:hypothetical protein
MSHHFPGKDYISLVDRLGSRLLEDLQTEISNFQLKLSASRIRDSPSLAQKQKRSPTWAEPPVESLKKNAGVILAPT